MRECVTPSGDICACNDAIKEAAEWMWHDVVKRMHNQASLLSLHISDVDGEDERGTVRE